MPLRPCLDCGRPSSGSRCPQHERARDKARGTTTARSYGAEHQRERARLLPLCYGTACPRCGQPMLPDQALDLGHSTPERKLLGLPGDRMEHADCNRGER